MSKKHKTCLFCKNKFIADRQIRVCNECLKIADIPEEIIKSIGEPERINYATEEKAKEEAKNTILEFIKLE